MNEPAQRNRRDRTARGTARTLLEQRQLCAQNIGDCEAVFLSEIVLLPTCGLEQLSLEGSRLTLAGIVAIADAICTGKTQLQLLELNNCALSDECIQRLAPALCTHSRAASER